jgi:sucrose-6-phosphate hydrolase SacC (GH32 family)
VITLRVLIDACSVEVFAADGATASTSLVLPTPNASAVRITAAASVGPIIARMLKPRQ